MKKYCSIILVALFSSLTCVNGQEKKEYFSSVVSLGGGIYGDGVLGEVVQYNALIGIGYIKRHKKQTRLSIAIKPFDTGWGVLLNTSGTIYKAIEFEQKNLTFELTPIYRFFLENLFLDFGYSFEYLSARHLILPQSLSHSVFNLPANKGLRTGLSFGAGYLLNISKSVILEPRLVLTLNNYSIYENELDIADDLVRNIRFLININLVRIK